MAESFSDAPVKAPTGAVSAVSPWVADPIQESFVENQTSRTSGGGRQEVFHDNARVERSLSEGVLAKIDAIEKREAKPDQAAPSEPAGDAAAPPAGTTAQDPPAVQQVAPAEPPPSPSVDDRLTRLEAANRALLAELESERKKPAPKRSHEAMDAYTDNQLDGLRKYVAASLGIDDPADKRVDDEIRDLYTDLTSHVLGVSPEEAHLAKREAARVRLALAREKRERTATTAPADPEVQKAQEAATFIGNRFATNKSLKDDYPLLHQFAEQLDGKKPETLVWEVLQRETKTGRIAFSQDDDANIAAAAKLVETHYQALADKLSKARPLPPPSTAQPSGDKPPTTTQSASKDTRQQPQARTLTSADASVAPATPPAPKTEPQSDKPPKFKNDKERREWALRRIPK